MAEPRAGRLRPLRGEPLPPGGGGPRLQGCERGPDDDAVLRQRGPPDRRRLAGGRPGAGLHRQRDHADGGGHHAGGQPTAAGSTCSTSTPWSRRGDGTRPASGRSTCAARTACTSRVRAGSTSGCGWPPSWRRWARPMPRPPRVAPGRGLCHHRRRHGSRSCPASSPPCHAGRRRGDGRPTGPDVLGRPGHRLHLPYRGPPGGRPAGVLPDPDAGGLPALRWLLHDRGLRRLGHLGPRREAAADGAAGGAHHAARAALRGREPRDHAPPPQHGRDAAPPRAALVPGHPGHRRRAAGQGRRRRTDAPGARALRRRGTALLPRVVQGAQRALLPAPRVRGRAGGAAARRRPAHLDHVAGAAAVSG